MLKFLIFIIAIQINLTLSSNIMKNRITFDKTFNLYYVGIRYQIIKLYCQCHSILIPGSGGAAGGQACPRGYS